MQIEIPVSDTEAGLNKDGLAKFVGKAVACALGKEFDKGGKPDAAFTVVIEVVQE